MKRRFKRKRGPVVSKKTTYDGITFASGLEKYMYRALKKAKIHAEYEGCIEQAYYEIKNRTGKMVNGTFKKD